MKIAVVLFNLGGPNNSEEVPNFLYNLFSDKHIINLITPFRQLLAKYISWKRTKTTRKIYQYIGGKSPLLDNTREQANRLAQQLQQTDNDNDYQIFIAMRYSDPNTKDSALAVMKYNPDKIILLPLYPQFSTTTTLSSINEWYKYYQYNTKTNVACCYFKQEEFIAAHVSLLEQAIATVNKQCNHNYKIIFSAHGLPEKIIIKGDPYQWQIEQSVAAIVAKLELSPDKIVVAYQSNIGKGWLKPSTEDEIIKSGQKKQAVIIVPISFVSEHSETLVELDIEYKQLSIDHQIPLYYRVPTLAASKLYIQCLAKICLNIDEYSNNQAKCVMKCKQCFKCWRK